MTFLMVFTSPSSFLQRLLSLALKRTKEKASTWLFHSKSINLNIPSLETHTLSLAGLGLYATVIRPDTKRLKVPRSRIPRTLKSFKILETIPVAIFGLPFLGLGKLGKSIKIDHIPLNFRRLFIEMKSNYAPDFLLGFFKPLFKSEFDRKSRSLLRNDLLKLALPLLKLSHQTRLQYYTYLRSGFNLFPRPLVKHKTNKRDEVSFITDRKSKR